MIPGIVGSFEKPPVLPTPLIKVWREDTETEHIYHVTTPAGQQVIYHGTTQFLNVIDKPGLRYWYKSQAVNLIKDRLNEKVTGVKKKKIIIQLEELEAICKEAWKRPDKTKKDAASLGTRAHAVFDYYLLHGTLPEQIDADIKPAVEAFVEWFSKQSLVKIAGDTKVASTFYEYGGSIDALFWKPGLGYILFDWKTSNSIWPEMALQVGGAYAQALNETYGIDVKQAWIVRFGKEVPVTFEAVQIRDLYTSLSGFLAAKNLSEILKQELFINKER